MRALLGNLGWRFFPLITLSISCHSLLASRVSAEKSANNLIGVPLYVTCFFCLAAFKIFSLSLILVSLINMCLRVFLLGFILYGTHCASWISHVREIFGCYLLEYFSVPFSSPSGTPVIQMLVLLMSSQSSLRLS